MSTLTCLVINVKRYTRRPRITAKPLARQRHDMIFPQLLKRDSGNLPKSTVTDASLGQGRRNPKPRTRTLDFLYIALDVGIPRSEPGLASDEMTAVNTHLDLDEHQLIEALRRGGHDTKRAAANAALAGYINLCKRRELLALRGKINWDGDLEQMRRSRYP